MTTIAKIAKTFKEQTEETKQANLASVKYIKGLARATDSNIGRWNIIKLFGQDDNENLINSLSTEKWKQALNGRFLEQLNKARFACLVSSVAVKVSGGENTVVDGVDTVGDVKRELQLSGYTAAVNGDTASDDTELEDQDWVTLAPAVKGG